MQRLIQSSLCNSLYFNLCSLLRSICFVCFLQEGGLFPGAILVAVAVVASPITAVPPQVGGTRAVTMDLD
jgi:hypothetical protein